MRLISNPDDFLDEAKPVEGAIVVVPEEAF